MVRLLLMALKRHGTQLYYWTSQIFTMPWGTFVYLQLPPWKRYYDTRNRLLIARKYHGYRLVTHTLPGSLVRLVFALWYEPHKLAQFWAFAAGLFDGLMGIKGKRHIWWRILNHKNQQCPI